MSHSPFFIDFLGGKRTIKLPGGYMLNGLLRDWPMYFLVGGIYPFWNIFVETIHAPRTQKELHLTRRQEATREDIQRLLGCLQGRFKIIRRESFNYNRRGIIETSVVCVFLHNMVAELRLDGKLGD